MIDQVDDEMDWEAADASRAVFHPVPQTIESAVPDDGAWYLLRGNDRVAKVVHHGYYYGPGRPEARCNCAYRDLHGRHIQVRRVIQLPEHDN